MKLRYMIAAALPMLMASCTDFDWHDEHDAQLGEFAITSENVISVAIDEDRSNADETVSFSWTPCESSDYTTVFYKIVFSPDGDFEHPAYEIETANLSTVCEAEVSLGQLNIMAERAGVRQNSTGTVKWSVMASTGLVSRLAETGGEIIVSRPSGYSYNPEYIAVVDGTENLGLMRQLSDGVFESFVKIDVPVELKEMATTVDRRFGITGETLDEGAAITPVNPGQIHHIVIDFNTAKASVKSVEQVGLWYAPAGKVVAQMTSPDGRPVWNCRWHFDLIDDDYRYKFHFTEKDQAGKESELFYGYSRATAANQSASSPENYFYLVAEETFSQSNYCFRFARGNFQLDHTLDITVDLSPDAENYCHTVKVID